MHATSANAQTYVRTQESWIGLGKIRSTYSSLSRVHTAIIYPYKRTKRQPLAATPICTKTERHVRVKRVLLMESRLTNEVP